MKTCIKPLLWMTIAIIASTTSSHAQIFYQENPTVMNLYHQLDSMFPKRYQTNRWLTGAQYWVNHWYESEEEYRKFKPEIDAMFQQLDGMRTFHKYTETTDSQHVQQKKYIMTLPSDINGQMEYLSFEADTKGVYFYYQTMNQLIDEKSDPVPDQSIVTEFDSLFNAYAGRKGTTEEDVHYQGNLVRIICLIQGPNRGERRTDGVKYVVPRCNERDYSRFYDLFHKYLKKVPLLVSTNDVYWQYHEVAVRVRLSNGRPMYMGAALKGNDLYLVRVEGSINGAGMLPRAWAEEDPVWKFDYMKKINTCTCAEANQK